MVKLTPELIQQSMQYINPVRDRELDLRGYKIPAIENLGATLDQFDTLDFSDNDIRKLDNFPLLKRIKTLFFNNNRIVRIADGLENCIPNLETLMLTGNQLQELCDIQPLFGLKKLTTLCLLQNPVSAKAHYRQYIIFKMPNLKLLDFKKIKMKEREEVNEFFKSPRGKEIAKDITKKAKAISHGSNNVDRPLMSNEERAKIKEAISNATSLEEVQRLSKLLQAGQIPGDNRHQNGKKLIHLCLNFVVEKVLILDI
uniref:Probable U2 small nuclear ribonucleoprotein A' n=1 Tax=Trichogramma kaykai TaxID=54128 RepID=A0ABD2WG43_9HYME